MPGERHVELLSGRAFFKVAHNPSRPFTVTAAGKRVRAIGTAFEVSMNGGEVAVVLAEGKVRVEEVEKAGNGTDMTPGRQLVITDRRRPEEHTSELQSLMRISYAVFCLKKKNKTIKTIL